MGTNIEAVLEKIVTDIPAPSGDPEKPLKALIFDSYYDSYKGVIIYVRVKEGRVKVGDNIRLMATGAVFNVVEAGFMDATNLVNNGSLEAGEVGYIAASIKSIGAISWTSSDESIAMVSPRGKVEAVKVGQVLIIAKSDRTGVSDTAKVSVDGPAEMPENQTTETKAPTPPTPKPATSSSKPAASGSKDLGYATFKGTWPNDVNGRMVFKTSHVIDSKDPKKRMAEAGDYVIGEWSEGHLVQGIWYGSNNQVKGSVILGK